MTISIPSTPTTSPIHRPAVAGVSDATVFERSNATVSEGRDATVFERSDAATAAGSSAAPASQSPVARTAASSAAVRVRQLWQPTIADLLVSRGLPRPGSLTRRSEAEDDAIRAAVACLDTLKPEQGGDTNLTYIAGHDLLKVAVVCGDAPSFDAVCTLIKHRVICVDRADGNEDTLLHSLARHGELPHGAANSLPDTTISLTDRVSALMQLGANTDVLNVQREWPLTLAWQRASVEGEEVATALLTAGADPLKEDTRGFNQIHKACASGDLASLQGWLRSGGAPDLRCRRRNETLIMLAACKNQTAVVDVLVDSGADLHAVDNLGLTALHQAVNTESREVVALLLKRGADPNGTPRDGSTPFQTTPLMSAARYAGLTGDDRILQTFIAHGADLDFRLSDTTPSARELFAQHSVGYAWSAAQTGTGFSEK